MKKTLTIGAASIALAAMPIVGVFAAQQTVTVTDTLQATITSACVFERYGESGAASQTDVTTGPAWNGPTTAGTADNDDTANPAVPPYHKYSATLKPGADVELGTSHFSGYCNDENGFEVTVDTPALSNGATTPSTLPFLSTAPAAATSEGYTITKGNGGTPAQFTNQTGDTVFMSSNAPTDESTAVTETATYNVYTISTTKAGTYTGNVTYTFTYEDPTSA
ncbi:hypothetical protein IKG24_01475 [Candidatus Saccharibacteria bacterium]|nr:hypothetical protein [Candidatus Saccharibacteria bacterium]